MASECGNELTVAVRLLSFIDLTEQCKILSISWFLDSIEVSFPSIVVTLCMLMLVVNFSMVHGVFKSLM